MAPYSIFLSGALAVYMSIWWFNTFKDKPCADSSVKPTAKNFLLKITMYCIFKTETEN